MGLPNMKVWILCFVLIGMVVLHPVNANPPRKFINLNPCKDGHGGLRPDCHPKDAPRLPANPYNRGCSAINRCRESLH